MKSKDLLKSVLLIIAIGLLLGAAVQASENGRSTYAPGTVGDFSMAVLPPTPGFYLRNELWYYTGNNTYDAFDGKLHVDADLSAWVETPRVTWVSGWNLLGARYALNFTLPIAYVESRARIDQNFPGSPPSSQIQKGDRLSFSDVYVAPLILDWKVGSVNIMWLETVTIPSGAYDSDRTVNVSRNYWALNSSLAATWRYPQDGPELDLRICYLLNLENPATDYRTGDELTADLTAVWRLNQRWAVGLTGYVYEQVSCDDGTGAVFGGFEGRSMGAGPIFRHIFSVGEHHMALVGKWIHEFEATNRYEGDQFFMALSTRL